MHANLTADLLARARGGDAGAFGAMTDPFRRELHLHCYRMLGSFQDAEDALQDTLLAAWQALAGFEERASLRTWLYRIATNRCLNLRRAAGRRPPKAWDVPSVAPPEPTQLGEVVWLEPYPDELLDPHTRYERAETVSLAFVTALQLLPPRQVAVVILRDVLGFQATEVAEMLDTTVDSVTSALKRARAGLARSRSPVAAGDGTDEAAAAAFARAWEAADLDAIVALLTADVFISMPPMPLEYVGRAAARRFCGTILAAGRRFELVPAAANGQPAFGAYLRAPDGTRHGVGLYVLEVAGDRVSAMTRFENGVLPWFGLPRSLPPQQRADG
jgi:RNA polymerase sigma-70 factor (ECF subfamily)